MRRVLLLRILFILILSGSLVSSADASPCYGTKMPKKKALFAGLQSHSLFKRYLKDEYGKIRSNQRFLLFSYGIYDWLCIDLKAGAGNIKQHPVGSDEIDYPSSFSGGYGLRLGFYEQKNVKLVFGFQHISVHPKRVRLGSVKNTGVLDDWQFSLLASYNFKRMTPYLGTKWSRVDYIHWIEEDRKRKKSDLTKSIGLVLGSDFFVSERVWFNLEGQFFDSEALAFSINYSF